MEDEIKTAVKEDVKTDVIPTLTLDDEEPSMNFVMKDSDDPITKVAEVPEQHFSEAEQRQIDQFAKQIDLRNMDQIMKYGSTAQKKSSSFSEAALKGVKTKDFGEIGTLLASLTTEVRGLSDKDDKGGFLGLFKKGKNKVEEMKVRYSDSETNINKIAKALEAHQFTLLKDISLMGKLYDENKLYFKELSMYIAAGQQKLNEVRNGELLELQKKAQESGLPEDAQEAKDLAAMCDRFEKKLMDLQLTRAITLQTAPQIRLIQEDDAMMAEKIQSTINNTIPLWKNQMVLALGVSHAAEAAKAQKLVSDATNEMLKKNADTLKMATVTAAQENERSIVDIETLKHTNDQLISTIDEVIKIQEEGHERRKAAEIELNRIEVELKDKLLEASGRKVD